MKKLILCALFIFSTCAFGAAELNIETNELHKMLVDSYQKTFPPVGNFSPENAAVHDLLAFPNLRIGVAHSGFPYEILTGIRCRGINGSETDIQCQISYAYCPPPHTAALPETRVLNIIRISGFIAEVTLGKQLHVKTVCP